MPPGLLCAESGHFHVRGKVVEKQQGKLATLTEAPIREPDLSDLDELCVGGFLRILISACSPGTVSARSASRPCCRPDLPDDVHEVALQSCSAR
jgi:hypothetical protein